jgi:hypothetical protein
MAFRGIQTTNIISTDVGFSDPLLILNKDGIQATDVGFLGKLGPTTYAGLVRDSETSNFLLLDSIELAPSTINDVSALDASIVKGSITVGTLTADTIIAGNIPSTLSDLTDIDNGSATTGDLILYDGSTWSYVNLESEINTRITASQNSQSLIGLSDVGHTSDTVANGDFLLYDSSTSKFAFVDFASEVNAYADGRIAATNSNHVSFGSSISATAFSGNIYDTNGNVLLDNTHGTAGFGGNISSSGASSFSGSVDFTGATISGFSGDTAGTHTGNVVGNVTGNVVGNIEGNILNSQGQPVIDNSGALYPTVFRLPKGLTAERPSPAVAGMMFFNEGTSMFEGYDGTNWIQFVPSTYQYTP